MESHLTHDIELSKKYEEMSDYKDGIKMTNSWGEIARNLITGKLQCRHKWKQLRDRFNKARQHMKGRSGDADGAG
ncbi:hypothetical protein AAFF_G00103400 [Aldrovandia affinis]|uniref:MADF domain-containing protein n=1 Tax=Aldrovandia affinis TaxID=143900 RepID=A0AAD7RUS3_9TELE|nr:hypothetical protein AAFF_G00103400 [Aldrovandia affinis]